MHVEFKKIKKISEKNKKKKKRSKLTDIENKLVVISGEKEGERAL